MEVNDGSSLETTSHLTFAKRIKAVLTERHPPVSLYQYVLKQWEAQAFTHLAFLKS